MPMVSLPSLALSSAEFSSPPPQAAVTVAASATATAPMPTRTARLILIEFPSPSCGVDTTSVAENLAEEVLGAIRGRVGEERFGRGVLDDLAVGPEQHAVTGAAREAHRVGHHEHGHALLGQRDHHPEHLVHHTP